MSVREKVLFAKRLAFLIHSGTPILSALRVLQKQSRSPGKSRILGQVMEDVSNGQYLSTSLGKFPNIFDPFAINLIRIGEESGTLNENLVYLAEEMNKKQELRRKVIGAMVYPIFIIIATLGVAGLLTIYIFPKILPVFASLSAKLPITTRILIWVNSFLLNYGLYLVLGLVALIIGVMLLLRLEKVKYWTHRSVLRLPLIGALSQNYQMANMCRTLGVLLKSDVRIVKAFNITAQTTSNLVYKKELYQVAESVSCGDKITACMENKPKLFPHIMTHSIDIGETTGKLDETLDYLSEMYGADVEDMTKNLSTAIEPVLMTFMGLLVGFIAISIITPIYEITQYLKP